MCDFSADFRVISDSLQRASDEMAVAQSVGQEVGDVLAVIGVVIVAVVQEVVGPFPEVDLCQLAAAHHGVDDGGVLSCIMVAAEEVVLPAYGQRTDTVFDVVITTFG